MRGKLLRIRKVRKYRRAAYPSLRPGAKRGGSVGRRALTAAAAPVVALGLGSLAGACDGGTRLVGEGTDATETVGGDDGGTEVEAVRDDGGTEVEAVHDDAGTDDGVADDGTEPDWIFEGDMEPGSSYVRYLAEAEGRAQIREAIAAESAIDIDRDPCLGPSLDERIEEDLALDVPAGPGRREVSANVDLLAPAFTVESPGYLGLCAPVERPDVGFEFVTGEAGDDEDVSGNPAGLTDGEEAALATLRAERRAAVSPIRSTDYPYEVWEYEDGYVDDSDRLRAEMLLRETVHAVLEDLRRDGLI